MTIAEHRTIPATAYLIVRGTRGWVSDSVAGIAEPKQQGHRIRSAKIVAVRQSRPTSLELDEVAVRVTVRVLAATFEPLELEADIVIDDPDLILRATVLGDAEPLETESQVEA